MLFRSRALVEEHGLSDFVELRLGKLEDYKIEGSEYRWYGRSSYQDLEDVDLLLVDGPPGATGPLARFPALPLLNSSLSPEACVILDDIVRAAEQEILASWLRNYPRFTRIDEGRSELGVLVTKPTDH